MAGDFLLEDFIRPGDDKCCLHQAFGRAGLAAIDADGGSIVAGACVINCGGHPFILPKKKGKKTT